MQMNQNEPVNLLHKQIKHTNFASSKQNKKMLITLLILILMSVKGRRKTN
jgi:hypothetical protein